MGSLAAQSEVQADADRLSKAGNADVVGLHCGCRLRVPSEATNRTGSARIVRDGLKSAEERWAAVPTSATGMVGSPVRSKGDADRLSPKPEARLRETITLK